MATHDPYCDSRSSGFSNIRFYWEREHAEREHDELNHRDDFFTRQRPLSHTERARRNISAKLANPLARISHDGLMEMGKSYALKHQMGTKEDIRAFEIGACLAQAPAKYSSVEGLTQEELGVLHKEYTNRWSQPKLMYIVIVLCSACASVQGMDQAVVNGGQLFYRPQFGIDGLDSRSTW